jgi:hypothetical protein
MAESSDMNFVDMNKALLERGQDFLEELLPGGTVVGNEYVCAGVDGGEGRSFSVNLTTGLWKEFAGGDMQGRDLVALYAEVKGLAQGKALHALGGGWKLGMTPKKTKGDDLVWFRGLPADKIWNYTDEKGNVHFETKRWDAREIDGVYCAKVIRPWCPATQRYEYPKTDARPLLNLKDISERSGPVVLVGGEKCADAVHGVGIIGTTIAGGESAVGKTDLSPLEDREVILWRDNDKAGEKWEAKIIEALKDVDPQSVRVVKVPDGMPAKWDAADATQEQRDEIIGTTRASVPVLQGITIETADDLAAGEAPVRNWIVSGAIAQAVPSIFYGPGGCGKSLVMLDLCIKVASRDKYGLSDCPVFIGNIPAEAHGPSIFFTLEDDRGELHRRIHLIDPGAMRSDKAPVFIIAGIDIPGFDPALMRHDGKLPALTQFAKYGIHKLLRRVTKAAGTPPKLLVIDPAGDFLDGDENDATIVKPFMRYLREIAVQYNLAIVLIAHDAKGQKDAEIIKARGSKGSANWTLSARFGFGFFRPKQSQATKVIKQLGLELTATNLDRVLFGNVGKSNIPHSVSGTRKFLQDSVTKLLVDITDSLEKNDDEDAVVISFKADLVESVRRCAVAGFPFCVSGPKFGLALNRNRLVPGTLRDMNVVQNKEITDMATDLINQGVLAKRSFWHGRKEILDVPDGPVHLNDPELRPVAEFPTNLYDTKEPKE